MKKILFVFALTLLFATLSFAKTFEIDSVHSTIGFKVSHLVGNVTGNFREFKGTIEMDEKSPANSKVSAEIEAKTINTNNEKRDEHLRSKDFFEADKYPKLTFKSGKIITSGKDKGKIHGTLSMHGVEKEVVLEVKLNGIVKDPFNPTVERAGFSATTKIDRKDFNIVFNKVLDKGALMVGNEVEINLEIEAVEKK